MPLSNGSFETLDTYRWRAAGWAESVNAVHTARFAEYTVPDSTQVLDSVERFDSGWGSFIPKFQGLFIDLTSALYDDSSLPKEAEDFEDLWGSGPAKLLSGEGPWPISPESYFQYTVDGVGRYLQFHASDFFNMAAVVPDELARVLNQHMVGVSAKVKDKRILLSTESLGTTASLYLDAAFEFGFTTYVTVYGTPYGAPWLGALEFALATYSGLAQEDAFDMGWGTYDLASDPTDSTRGLTFVPVDTFNTGWGDTSLISDPYDIFGRFAGALGEAFETTWSAMTTIT